MITDLFIKTSEDTTLEVIPGVGIAFEDNKNPSNGFGFDWDDLDTNAINMIKLKAFWEDSQGFTCDILGTIIEQYNEQYTP